MKKLIVAVGILVLAGACHSAPAPTTRTTPTPMPAPSGNATGAADPMGAIRGFMTAVEQQDLQAMGAFWGGPDGPARELFPQDELYKRELVIICYARHDSYDVVGDAPSASGGRTLALNVSFKGVTRATTAEIVRGPNNRWYVKDIDANKLRDICAKK